MIAADGLSLLGLLLMFASIPAGLYVTRPTRKDQP